MFSKLLSKALDQIAVVETFIDLHNDYVKTVAQENGARIKTYAVTACITRLYAIYERFIESILADYLDALPELIKFESLSEGFKKSYRHGISSILSKIDSERYCHLKHENVVEWYHQAISGNAQYRFVTEALTHHEQNLRLGIISELLSRIDLKDLDPWICHSAHIKALYEEQTELRTQLDSELKLFIELRNDVSHGSLESLEGKDNLRRYCKVIRSFIGMLSEYCHKNLLFYRVSSGRMILVGEVTEIFPRANAFIIQLDLGCSLGVQSQLHIVGNSFCAQHRVESLRIKDAAVEQVSATFQNFEIGVRCDVNPNKLGKVYMAKE